MSGPFDSGGAEVGQYIGDSLSAKMIGHPTLQQRLDMAVTQAEKKLAEAKEARDILARNPDLERLLDIMQKGHF